MTRTLIATLVAAVALAGTAAAGTANAAGGAYYHAELTSAAPQDRVIAKRLVWNCDGTSCVATRKSPSRDRIVCSALVKKVGALDSFSVRGEAMPADRLALCNAAAD